MPHSNTPAAWGLLISAWTLPKTEDCQSQSTRESPSMYLACILVPVTFTYFLCSKKLGLNVVLNHMTLQVFEIMAFFFP